MTADPRLLDAPVGLLLDRLSTGALRASELAEVVIARLAAEGAAGLAWHDPEHLRRQAQHLDAQRLRGRPIGALHGLPVAVEDGIDTARMPTGQGIAALRDRVPEQDATLATGLRRAGAVIVGKAKPRLPGLSTEPVSTGPALSGDLGVAGESLTVPTAEGVPAGQRPASRQPPGLVAALAARQAVFGVGADADGSLTVAAGQHDLVALRPTPGLIDRAGILPVAPGLDAACVVAADLDAAARLADGLCGTSSDLLPAPPPRLAEAAAGRPPVAPTLGFLSLPGIAGDAAGAEAHDALCDILGSGAFAARLPAPFAQAGEQMRRVLAAEAAHALAPIRRRFETSLPARTLALIEAGAAIRAGDYLAALDWRRVLRAGLETALERCDVLVLPDGPALAVFLGLPLVTLPLLQDASGRPVAVHLAARAGEDARLVRTAAWLQTVLKRLEVAA
ncbi:amidase [Aurantimonas sp. MSK8Z-1]|uniref:amidase family protein n=1 Tax=Mangrovibrevibacter kandeliae TaxID=2968473 RepID=UPI0021188DFA|nr:amidase family protein [Aurantimonas sp. MSK8Z-1]MCW4115680.1 amidase [Aurantimonas sp. MSK8Z-1]